MCKLLKLYYSSYTDTLEDEVFAVIPNFLYIIISCEKNLNSGSKIYIRIIFLNLWLYIWLKIAKLGSMA